MNKYKKIEKSDALTINENVNDYVKDSNKLIIDTYNTIINKTDTMIDTKYLNYIYTLPNSINIFKNVKNNLNELKDVNIKKDAINVLMQFQKVILDNKRQLETIGYLPPLSLYKLDDGSFIIEWIFKDFRIGFSLEHDEKQSGWYLITNKTLGDESRSGLLREVDITALVSKLISYVISNV